MNINIKQKFVIILITVIITFTSLSSFIYIGFIKIQDTILKELVLDLMIQLTKNIENELKKISNLSFLIMTDSKIQDDLKSIQNNNSAYHNRRLQDQINERLFSFTFNERYLKAIYIFIPNGEECYSRVDLPKMDADFKNKIIDESLKKNGGHTWLYNDKLEWSLLSLREIREYKNISLKYLGIVAIGIDVDVVMDNSFNKNLNYDIDSAIFYKDTLVHFSNNNLNVSEKEFLLKKMGGINNNFVKIKNKKFLVTKIKSDAVDDWSFVWIFPYYNILNKFFFLNIVLVVLFFIILFFLTMYGIRFTLSITDPIKTLAAFISNVKNKNFNLKKINLKILQQNIKQDEIGTLYKEFDAMIKKIDKLINENYKKQLIIKDAQLRTLQAQINPHFLYNTLESINWIAKINKQEKIAIMVKSIGNLLRNSISENMISTINDQMSLLLDYINIQKIRYEDRLFVNIFIDDKIADFYMPKLLLQPIVENSIKYGLEVLTGECIIDISLARINDKISIKIKDNGPGISKDLLKKILVGKIKTHGSGIGLINIKKRLNIIYGKKYLIRINSNENKGTIVEISIPCWTFDDFSKIFYRENINV